jgi:DnaJ-class molecular chaperone
MSHDYYQALGVSRTASADEIQKAYRRLARKHHPDLAEDKQKAKEQFQRIQQAYDVLSDPEKRRMYDQLGPNFESYAQAGRGPFGGPQGPAMEFDLRDLFGAGGAGGAPLDEILRQFGGQGPSAGGRRRSPTPQPDPADAAQEITIPFQTAVLGGQHQLQWLRDGSTESVTIRIPPGIESGQTLRLRGQGPARRGKRGDLLVTVHIAAHPHFERHAANLHVRVPISIREAILGAKIDLPTPHGVAAITIPPMSSSGQLLRLKGMGVKPAGDLIAELQIVLPKHLSTAQRDGLQEWAESIDEQPRRQLVW